MTRTQELTRLRLVAQRIAGPPAASVVEAVAGLTAVQGQDYPGALTSIALRSPVRTRAAVEAALTDGSVVRSWPMRGTLHFVAAVDLPWLLTLTAARVVEGQALRRRQLELTDADLERARGLAVDALAGGHRLGRAELLAVWAGAGLSTAGQRGYHLIAHLAQTGTICFGPVEALAGKEQLLVLLDEWIPEPRRPERDEALRELAGRYFRGHGPATVADLARWTKLRAGDVRTAVALARPELEALTVDGVEYLMDPATPDRLAAVRRQARGVFLLPGFDEYLLGYGDRTAVLAPEFADRIVPGSNGIFLPTVVADGRVVATWRRVGPPSKRTLQVSAFTELSGPVAAAVERVYATLP
jgi:hypothetical protein